MDQKVQVTILLMAIAGLTSARYPNAVGNSHYQAPQAPSAALTNSYAIPQYSAQGAAPLSLSPHSSSAPSFSPQSSALPSFHPHSAAPPPSNSYGPPQNFPSGPPSSSYGAPAADEPEEDLSNLISADDEIPQVHKYVFVHSAGDDGPRKSKIRKITAPGGKQKYVNIIFVKAPAAAAPDQQVVEIPHDGGRKNVVYVLLRKADQSPDVKFSVPKPTQASKPEVYFIRYKDGEDANGKGGNPGGKYGPPAPPSSAPSQDTPTSSYGPPGHQAGTY